MEKNIIFKLNNGDNVKVTESEFATLELSKKLADHTHMFVDLGIRGFQKHSLVSWGPEEVKEEEVIVQ